jgi:hypothetical protein
VFFASPVANLGEVDYPLDHPDAVLDFGSNARRPYRRWYGVWVWSPYAPPWCRCLLERR